MHEDRLALAEAMDSIRGLLLDGWVPPAVEVKDVVRGRQVQTAASGAQRDDQHLRAALAGERLQQLRSLAAVQMAVEERCFPPEALLQVRHQRREARVLREHERLVSGRHRAQQLDEALEL